jgi:hypothetical protein
MTVWGSPADKCWLGLRRNFLGVIVLLIALIPSAKLAWRFADMPQLGVLYDDAIYWVCAKSLAEGKGYRTASLPGEPYQTLYPPLYPLILSAVWRINPDFPGNLPIATLFAWMTLPIFVILARLLFSEIGFGRLHSWTLSVLLALNPFIILYSLELLSEMTFSCFLLGAIILAERAGKVTAPNWLAAIAGLAAAAAYLTRTAGIVLLISCPLCFLARRQRAKAMIFAGAMLPAVVGWSLWVYGHARPSWDGSTLYYTRYVDVYGHNFSWSDLPTVISANFRQLLDGISSLLVIAIGGFGTVPGRLVAVAAVASTVYLVNKKQATHYLAFSVLYVVLLLSWPSNSPGTPSRLVLPVFPLLLAGLSVPLLRGFRALQLKIQGLNLFQGVIAGLALAVLIVSGAVVLMSTYGAIRYSLPGMYAGYREGLSSSQPLYRWISSHLPADTTVLAYRHPIVYLHTGRKAMGPSISAIAWYRGRGQPAMEWFRSLQLFAARRKLSYLLVTSIEFEGLSSGNRAEVQGIVSSDSGFYPVYSSASATVYRIDSLVGKRR